MKYKKLLGAAAAFSMTFAVSGQAFAIEYINLNTQTHSVKQADGSYRYVESHKKPDGSLAKNEWIQLDDQMGAKVWMYFGDDGFALTDTTTPDNFTVNDKGFWYHHNPGAIHVDAPDPHYQNAYYPFSYDGAVLKNDYLGVQLTYGAPEAAEDYDLTVADSQGSMSYGVFKLDAPSGASAGFGVSNPSYNDPAYIQETIAFYADLFKENGGGCVPCSMTIAGKTFNGYTTKSVIYPLPDPFQNFGGLGGGNAAGTAGGGSSNTLTAPALPTGNEEPKSGEPTISYTTSLYSPAVNGAALDLGFRYSSPEEMDQIVSWLNAHMTFSK